MSKFGEELCAVAASQVGYIEGPNNDNKYGEYFGANNQPWCAYFLMWCLAMCGADPEAAGFTGSVSSFYAMNNRVVSQLVPGDFVCFGQKRPYWTSEHQHAEMFIEFDTNGNLRTIGGNTSSTSQSEGDGVEWKTRDADEVTACVHYDPGGELNIPIWLLFQFKRRLT